MSRALNIVVLKGGRSSEREVSLDSGECIANALRALGHNVLEVVVNDHSLNGFGGFRPDIAFVALHGGFGEDGGMQALLEARGIPYTGSGVEASKLAMNKVASKELFFAAGVPTPEYFGVTGSAPSSSHRALAERLGFPVVVKPVAEGSSVGVTIVTEMEGLEAGLKDAFVYGGEAMIEKFVPGREMTVGILDGRALPVVEIVPKGGYYDYHAKYKAEDTEYLTEFELDSGVYRAMQEACVNAHNALGCKVFSRVDVRLDPANNFFVLEVNTIPGFTSHSLLPKAAKAAGIDFGDLCQRIVEVSLREHAAATSALYPQDSAAREETAIRV